MVFWNFLAPSSFISFAKVKIKGFFPSQYTLGLHQLAAKRKGAKIPLQVKKWLVQIETPRNIYRKPPALIVGMMPVPSYTKQHVGTMPVRCWNTKHSDQPLAWLQRSEIIMKTISKILHLNSGVIPKFLVSLLIQCISKGSKTNGLGRASRLV